MQDLLPGGKMTKLQLRVHILRPSHPYMVFINSSEPTHLLPVSTSCIDLIFTDQSNLVVDSGTHSGLFPGKSGATVFNNKIELFEKVKDQGPGVLRLLGFRFLGYEIPLETLK